MEEPVPPANQSEMAQPDALTGAAEGLAEAAVEGVTDLVDPAAEPMVREMVEPLVDTAVATAVGTVEAMEPAGAVAIENDAAEALLPTDETHDSIDPQTGALTPEATSRRAQIIADLQADGHKIASWVEVLMHWGAGSPPPPPAVA